MKKQLLLFFGLLMTLQGFSQNVNIPDANFKAYLTGNSSIDTDGDGEIQLTEANSFTGTINCSNMNISDLTGIEEFFNLTTLDCSSNQITSIDLSNNTELTTLICYYNHSLNFFDVSSNIKLSNLTCYGTSITNLDVTNNLQLKILVFNDNYFITSLDLTNNIDLEYLYIDSTPITSIDISNNTKLIHFYCSFIGHLTSLDVSNNPLLTELGCDYNQLTSLDVSNNPDLEFLYVTNNSITSLNLSNNTKLTTFHCDYNNLNSLNLKNGFNTNIHRTSMTSNPNLTCVEVDDSVYSHSNWVNKDIQTNYSNNCNGISCTVNIPDTNFKNALLNHYTVIDTNNDGEIQCVEALAVTGLLNVASSGIVDTTGLEAFENITRLALFNNDVTSIDLSSNLLLEQLLLESNELVTIDISMLTVLTDFKAHSNLFTSANVANGNNANMWRMQLQGNPSLTCIQIDAGYTPTTPTWLKDNTANYNTNCGPCIVNIPDVNFKNAILNHSPVIDTNNDGEVQCSEALAVTGMLNVAGKSIVDTTGLEAFENITRLAMYSNNITSIDVSSNLFIQQLLLSINNITTIDISMLTNLTDFKAHSNSLTSANLANGNNVNMTRMQLQGNPSLNCVKIDASYTPTTPTWLIDNISSYAISCSVYPKASSSYKNTVEVIKNTISVFPNPTRNTITINSDENIEKITLCTISGKVLMTGVKTNTLDLSQLDNGVFLLVINTKTETINKKIIKQ